MGCDWDNTAKSHWSAEPFSKATRLRKVCKTESLAQRSSFCINIKVKYLPLIKMAKGRYKRRAAGSQFRRQAFSQDTPQDSIQPGPSSIPDSQPDSQPANENRCPQLRSQALKEMEEIQPLGNRIINLPVFLSALNGILQAHHITSENCAVMDLKVHKENKVGLGSDFKFACGKCGFVSNACRTYNQCIAGQELI